MMKEHKLSMAHFSLHLSFKMYLIKWLRHATVVFTPSSRKISSVANIWKFSSLSGIFPLSCNFCVGIVLYLFEIYLVIVTAALWTGRTSVKTSSLVFVSIFPVFLKLSFSLMSKGHK